MSQRGRKHAGSPRRMGQCRRRLALRWGRTLSICVKRGLVVALEIVWDLTCAGGQAFLKFGPTEVYPIEIWSIIVAYSPPLVKSGASLRVQVGTRVAKMR